MNIHKIDKQEKCDDCGKVFYFKWRLKKHKEMHTDKNVKKCHYFNNDKICPYEEIGCKFQHVESLECIFKKKCTFQLCQYRHTNKSNEQSNDNSQLTEEFEDEIDEQSIKDDERFLEQIFPKTFRKYVEVNLVGRMYIDCYYCGFDTDFIPLTQSKKIMTDHIRENHMEEIKDYKKDDPCYDNEKDFNMLFETGKIKQKNGHISDSW